MNIKTDSRKVTKNDIFVALRGVHDGHSYIEDARKKGAFQIIAEEGVGEDIKIVPNTRIWLEEYLKENYYDKIKDLTLIGITGTNGKTTTAYLIYQLLNQLGRKAAYIGTIGFFTPKTKKVLQNTTPDLLDLYEYFLEAKEEKVEVIVMEVSSQGLFFGRVNTLLFDQAIFTNLTEDHIEFHGSMEAYMKEKLKLFSQLRNDKIAILNKEDPSYYDFFFPQNKNIFYGKNGHYQVEEEQLFINKSTFTLLFEEKRYQVMLPLPAKYNISNYLAALTSVCELGYSIEEVVEKTKYLEAPSGRFEYIPYKEAGVIIDYAHTADATYNILKNVQSYCLGKVITILGCGGNRDRLKRGEMGKTATDYSTYVIFTNDNPRMEPETEIMKDIVEDLKSENYEIIFDRKEAIEKGMGLLKENDLLVILGKGHENYQIIQDKKIPFSDKECVLNWIEKNNKEKNMDNVEYLSIDSFRKDDKK